MEICIIGGAGYVGLVTGLGFAEMGNHVVNVDIDGDRISKLQNGISPILEEGIEPILRRNLDSGRLEFSSDVQSAVVSSEFVFIAVGTPSLSDGQADLSQVISVTEQLVQCLDSYKVIVIKSTVPVGTVELVRSILSREKREHTDFDIVSNPEFLKEGKGLRDFFFPDRIVVGTCSERSLMMMRQLYEPIMKGKVSFMGQSGNESNKTIAFVQTDLASSQMIKYASNAFLASRISFMNEIAGLCERVGANIKEVSLGMGYDPRIGADYLDAGLGFGGPCLEKDLRALIKIAEANGFEPQILRAVLERNELQITTVLAKLKSMLGYLLYQRTIAVFGLAFKAETNDVRNSLSIRVIDNLKKEGAFIHAHDPGALQEARDIQPDLKYFEDPYEAVNRVDALLILTEWPQFASLDYSLIKSKMNSPYIIDARNFLDGSALRELGFIYDGIGQKGAPAVNGIRQK